MANLVFFVFLVLGCLSEKTKVDLELMIDSSCTDTHVVTIDSIKYECSHHDAIGVVCEVPQA